MFLHRQVVRRVSSAFCGWCGSSGFIDLWWANTGMVGSWVWSSCDKSPLHHQVWGSYTLGSSLRQLWRTSSISESWGGCFRLYRSVSLCGERGRAELEAKDLELLMVTSFRQWPEEWGCSCRQSKWASFVRWLGSKELRQLKLGAGFRCSSKLKGVTWAGSGVG